MNRLLTISDIHGCFDTFHELVVNRIKLTKSDKLVLLGDYIDRGSKSREVIDFIIDLINSGYNIVPLAGNHESMLIDSFRDQSLLPVWLMNSGETTLESFEIGSIDNIDKKYLDFLTNLSYYHRSGKFLFVHAGFNDYESDPFSDTHGMIWNCHPKYNNPLLRDQIIIHGHRPMTMNHVMEKIAAYSAVIPIDTGCVYGTNIGYGHLSALEVNSMELIAVENIEEC
jgi:serine/threonine protein phosphatase 1